MIHLREIFRGKYQVFSSTSKLRAVPVDRTDLTAP
jgi:hypothetical protein